MVTIVQSPSNTIEPVYSEDGVNLSWVVDSDLKHLCSMKYVADVTVTAYGNLPENLPEGQTRTYRVKLSPNNVDGTCTFSLNRIIEDSVTMGSDSQGDGVVVYGTDWLNRTQAIVSIEFREETDGTIGCTGSAFEVGPPSEETGQAKVWNGTIQWMEQSQSIDSKYLVNTAGPTGMTAGNRKFLTDSPNVHYVYANESHALAYISSMPTGAAQDIPIRIRRVLKSGQQTVFWIRPAWYTSASPTVLQVGCGPWNLNFLAAAGLVFPYWNGDTPVNGPIITCDTDYYELALSNYDNANICYPGGPEPCDDPATWFNTWTKKLTEIHRFYVSCPCDTYTPYRLAWLNKRGGLDYYTFRLASKRAIAAETKEWTEFRSKWNPISTSYGYTETDRGRNTYGAQAVEKVSVHSTWMSAESHEWLSQILYSPKVYYMEHIGAPNAFTSPYRVHPVMIDTKTMQIRSKEGVGNRLLSHDLEFTYAYPIISQRG